MGVRTGIVLTVMLAAAGLAGAEPSLTCDADAVNPRSYRLTTRGVALAVTEECHDWWDSFELGKYAEDLYDLNLAVTRAAERALEIDPTNLMAHGILARQYLILEESEGASAAWATVLGSGGSVVWTGTLYDVDARTYFVLAFDRRGIRIYRFDQLAGAVKRRFYGIPDFPGPENERFWAASGGCIDSDVVPEAEVPWSAVREIKAGNWVLWFKLDRKISVSSDRNGKRKELGEIKVNLHGRTGDLEVYKPVGEDHLAMRGRGPAGFQDAVRRMIVRFVDPEHRIALPPLKPGVGW